MPYYELKTEAQIVQEGRPVQIVQKREGSCAILREYTGYYNARHHQFTLYPCRSSVAIHSAEGVFKIDADAVRRPRI